MATDAFPPPPIPLSLSPFLPPLVSLSLSLSLSLVLSLSPSPPLSLLIKRREVVSPLQSLPDRPASASAMGLVFPLALLTSLKLAMETTPYLPAASAAPISADYSAGGGLPLAGRHHKMFVGGLPTSTYAWPSLPGSAVSVSAPTAAEDVLLDDLIDTEIQQRGE